MTALPFTLTASLYSFVLSVSDLLSSGFRNKGIRRMNLSIDGHSQVPPGFRFHPTEEELLHYYLRKKVASNKIDLDVICEVDLNKLEPWDIQEKCKIGSTPQNDWYFFSHKDKKYPTGTRTNRATAAGFWKATGRDKIIYSSYKRIGLRKTLVFYKGRAPHGQKSDWIMHEYRLDENGTPDTNVSNTIGESTSGEDGWVVCRVFRKKNYQKSLESPKIGSSASMHSNSKPEMNSETVLNQILFYMGTTCKMENESLTQDNDMRLFVPVPNNNTGTERIMHLPRLDETPYTTFSSLPLPIINHTSYEPLDDGMLSETRTCSTKTDWVTLDRLVASQLNGQVVIPDHELPSFTQPNEEYGIEAWQFYSHRQNQAMQNSENELWNFNKAASPSPSNPLGHFPP